MKRNLLLLVSALFLFSSSSFYAQPPIKKPLTQSVKSESKEAKHDKDEHHDAEEEHSHAISIDEVLKGNDNFRANVRKNQDFDKQREELSKGQKPHTIVVACSDSRVCPEIVLDNGLGEIFVVRTAGNVVDSVALGSIEYAAEHLHSQNLVIMGHTSCGAVTAALSGETESPYINSIIRNIQPAVKFAKNKKADKNKTLNLAIEENVRNQIKMIKKSKIIAELTKEGHLNIVGCVYHLDTGEITYVK
jgi:carbonic anhydrase